MISFWEKQSLLSFDIAVVGAGLTGLSAALSIKEMEPSLRVGVLEAGLLPNGASTKNAGFACFGSLTEILEDIKKMGEDQALELVEKRWIGLRKLRTRLHYEPIGYQSHGGFEVGGQEMEESLEQIEYVNGLLYPIFKRSVFTIADEKLSSFGLAGFKHLVYNPFEGQLDSGKLMDALWAKAAHSGVRVFTGCRVIKIESGYVSCVGIDFRADKVLICTNAFARELCEELDVVPGRGIVLVTKPLTGISFHGAFHWDRGFYYFRDLGDRVLFGGGRHLDFEGETTSEFGINDLIYKDLCTKLKENILPGRTFEVDMVWSGIMGFGSSKMPIIKELEWGKLVAVRMGGMGVALSSWAGEELAKLALGR